MARRPLGNRGLSDQQLIARLIRATGGVDNIAALADLLQLQAGEFTKTEADLLYAAADHDHDLLYAAIDHSHDLADLDDVDLTGQADTNVLTRVGGIWTPQTPAGGGGALSYLGYNTVGGSSEAITNARQYMKKITVASNGIIVSISAYMEADSQQQNSAIAGVLTDNAGAPLTLIAASGQVTNTGMGMDANVPRWIAFPIGLPVVAGDYWIAYVSNGGGARTIYYDGSGSDRYITSASGDMRDVFEATTTSSNRYSIRAAFLTT